MSGETQTKIQSNQVTNQNSVARLEATERTDLDLMIDKIAQALNEPGWIGVSGGVSGFDLELGGSSVVVLDSGKKKVLCSIAGEDLSGVSGTFNISTGIGTGAVQNLSLPSIATDHYVKLGFELRSDKLIYPILGTTNATENLSGVPAFSKKDAHIYGIVQLRNGTSGTGNLLAATLNNISQYVMAGYRASSAALVGAGLPATTPDYIGQIYFDNVRNREFVSVGTSSSDDWKLVQSMAYDFIVGGDVRERTHATLQDLLADSNFTNGHHVLVRDHQFINDAGLVWDREYTECVFDNGISITDEISSFPYNALITIQGDGNTFRGGQFKTFGGGGATYAFAFSGSAQFTKILENRFIGGTPGNYFDDPDSVQPIVIANNIEE